jgi:hypothetical protein
MVQPSTANPTGLAAKTCSPVHVYHVNKVGTSARMNGFERRLKLAANGL